MAKLITYPDTNLYKQDWWKQEAIYITYTTSATIIQAISSNEPSCWHNMKVFIVVYYYTVHLRS